jgi:hypothetical protein
MIKNYFKTLFSVYRMVWTGNKSAMQLVGTFYGHLQQSQTLTEGLSRGSMTKPFRVWCPVDTDIQEGDNVLEGTSYYNVRGVNQRDFAGRNKHLEVALQKIEDYASI